MIGSVRQYAHLDLEIGSAWQDHMELRSSVAVPRGLVYATAAVLAAPVRPPCLPLAPSRSLLHPPLGCTQDKYTVANVPTRRGPARLRPRSSHQAVTEVNDGVEEQALAPRTFLKHPQTKRAGR